MAPTGSCGASESDRGLGRFFRGLRDGLRRAGLFWRQNKRLGNDFELGLVGVLVTCAGWGRTTRGGEVGVSGGLPGRCRPHESGPNVPCRLSAPVESGPSPAVPRRAAVHGARAIRLPWVGGQTAGSCRDSGRPPSCPVRRDRGGRGAAVPSRLSQRCPAWWRVAVSVGVPVLAGSGLRRRQENDRRGLVRLRRRRLSRLTEHVDALIWWARAWAWSWWWAALPQRCKRRWRDVSKSHPCQERDVCRRV